VLLGVLALAIGGAEAWSQTGQTRSASAAQWWWDESHAVNVDKGQYERSSPGNYRSSQGEDSRYSASRSSQKGGLREQEASGWALVTYDLGNDGQVDGFEYIYIDDLEQARQRSAIRSDRPVYRGQERSQARSERSPSHRGNYRVHGELSRLKSIYLLDEDQPHVLAKIDPGDGRRIPVDLGPRSDLGRLNLGEGDRLTVTGYESRINNRRMLMATTLESEYGQRVTINRHEGQPRQMIDGRVLSVRTANTGRSAESSMLARVQTDDGRVVQLDLGPADEARDLNISHGDEVSVLGHRGQLQGEETIIASHVSVNDGGYQRIARAEYDRQTSQQGTQGQGVTSRFEP
jgi:hypothetical protein